MWKVSLKGLIAHKYRLALTSIAVVLGVAFMAGTFVLTDTLGNLFTGLFESANQGVAAVVRAKQPFTGQEGPGGAEATRPPVPDTLLPELASTPGVRAVEGSIQGVALVVGKDGKALTNLAGAPNLGVAWSDNPDFPRALHLVTGHAPRPPARWGSTRGRPRRATSASAIARGWSSSRCRPRSSRSRASSSSVTPATSPARRWPGSSRPPRNG